MSMTVGAHVIGTARLTRGVFAAEAAETSNLIQTETAAVVLIAIAAGVAVLARRFEFPFTVALVLAGFAATLLGDLVEVDVSADVILFLLVPPLLFEATLHLAWPKLKADLFPALVLALVGTLIGTVAIGALTRVGLDLPWEAAFAFGALISATDPVAVIAFFRSLGTPKRLSVLVEGESLFNDAVAVVAFGLAIEAAEGEAFTFGGALTDFVVVSAGGILVGLVLGYVVSEVILARVDDALIETTTTMALAYGSFLVAEEFGLIVGRDVHFSGILAVVVAGLMVGNVGIKNTSPSTRVTLEHSWELLTFLVNSVVFLFIGLTITPANLIDELDAVAIAVAGVVAVRIVVVYGLSAVIGLIKPNRMIPMAYRHVMLWGGLRGAISLALVLTVTEEQFSADTVQTVRVMTFGVVLFTLLVQGTTIAPLIRRLGLAGANEQEVRQQRLQAKIVMGRAGQSEVARLGADGALDDDLAQALGRSYQAELAQETAALAAYTRSDPELEAAMLFRARRDAINAERSALSDVVVSGLIDGEVAQDLSRDLDIRVAALDLIEGRIGWDFDAEADFADLDDGIEAVVITELGWLRAVGQDVARAHDELD